MLVKLALLIKELWLKSPSGARTREFQKRQTLCCPPQNRGQMSFLRKRWASQYTTSITSLSALQAVFPSRHHEIHVKLVNRRIPGVVEARESCLWTCSPSRSTREHKKQGSAEAQPSPYPHIGHTIFQPIRNEHQNHRKRENNACRCVTNLTGVARVMLSSNVWQQPCKDPVRHTRGSIPR